MRSADTPMPASGRRFGLSSSTLKIIACVTMLIDHVGVYLLLYLETAEWYFIARFIGRLAFPIFAFCIAQGCRYTRNKAKRFLLVFGLGVICELVFWLYSGQLEGNILLTFSCSILLIYTIQAVKMALAKMKWYLILISLACFVAALFMCRYANLALGLDYGLYGIALPAFAVLPDYREGEAPAFLRYVDRHWVRVICFGVGLFIHWWMRGADRIQMFAFLALIPIALYNGKPGSRKLKYAFYLFYPVHLVVIWLVGMVVTKILQS